MKHSPSEADSGSANHLIAYHLWNPEVHYRDNAVPPLVPGLSHLNPLSSCFVLYFALSSTPRSPKWFVSSSGLYVCSHLAHAC
jgi:hypothetical protein